MSDLIDVTTADGKISPDNVQSHLDVAGLNAAGFCGSWPAIREGLTLLQNFASATLKPIVGLVIAAGDGICPKASN
jgi:hypothetical protein